MGGAAPRTRIAILEEDALAHRLVAGRVKVDAPHADARAELRVLSAGANHAIGATDRQIRTCQHRVGEERIAGMRLCAVWKVRLLDDEAPRADGPALAGVRIDDVGHASLAQRPQHVARERVEVLDGLAGVPRARRIVLLAAVARQRKEGLEARSAPAGRTELLRPRIELDVRSDGVDRGVDGAAEV